MWGSTSFGDDCIPFPRLIKIEGKAAAIECGYEHSLLITTRNLIYSCGDCPASGHGANGGSRDHVPKLIAALSKRKIICCAAGEYHSLCVDDEGIVYSFGSGPCGQLGHGDRENQLTPKVIQFFVVNNIKAKECMAGGCGSAVISDSGELYLFGPNRFYQLGLKDKEDRLIPTKLSLPQSASIKKVSMGLSHTAFITE